jgi:hypothetical protein
MGRVQRQVTARPTQTYRAPQLNAQVDPRADDFTKGLAALVDTAGVYGQQKREKARDAQALTADVGSRGYLTAAQQALESDPSLYEDEERRQKLDEELRERYLGEVTDPDILQRVGTQLDGWWTSAIDTRRFQQEEQNRMRLSSEGLIGVVDKLEAAVTQGADRAAAIQGLREYGDVLQNSESFRLPPEKFEGLIRDIQNTLAPNRALLLAEAYMDDENISAETRMWLRAKHAEAMKATTVEKEVAQIQVLQDWEGRINRGAMTWEYGTQAVQAGLATAEQLQSAMRRQQKRLEEAAKESQGFTNLLNASPLDIALMSTSDKKAYVRQLRQMVPPQVFYAKLTQQGIRDDVVENLFDQSMVARSGPVTRPEEIPDTFRQFMDNDGRVLYGMGIAAQQLPPAKANDLIAYQTMVQHFGMSEVEAYNMLYEAPASIYNDIAPYEAKAIKEAVASKLDMDLSKPNRFSGVAVDLAMRLVKSTGIDADEAAEWVVSQYDRAMIRTDFGVIPKSLVGSYGVTDEQLKQRVEWAVNAYATSEEIDPSTISLNVLDNGVVLYQTLDGTMLDQHYLPDLLNNQAEGADGSTSIEGLRIENVRIDQQRQSNADRPADRENFREWYRERLASERESRQEARDSLFDRLSDTFR